MHTFSSWHIAVCTTCCWPGTFCSIPLRRQGLRHSSPNVATPAFALPKQREVEGGAFTSLSTHATLPRWHQHPCSASSSVYLYTPFQETLDPRGSKPFSSPVTGFEARLSPASLLTLTEWSCDFDRRSLCRRSFKQCWRLNSRLFPLYFVFRGARIFPRSSRKHCTTFERRKNKQ
uniref:Secreted protein n=1 Tax=Ixodes ricinus TaxID=34613 RepID=A0A6B0UYC4_IXORI